MIEDISHLILCCSVAIADERKNYPTACIDDLDLVCQTWKIYRDWQLVGGRLLHDDSEIVCQWQSVSSFVLGFLLFIFVPYLPIPFVLSSLRKCIGCEGVGSSESRASNVLREKS